MPTIVLGTDEVDCFCAWVSAEAGLPEHAEAGSDLKVSNYTPTCAWNTVKGNETQFHSLAD